MQDVGQAILESYSRIIESLAFTVLSRIEDVMHADSHARDPTSGEQRKPPLKEATILIGSEKLNAKEELEKLNSAEAPGSMTLLDFMGWNMDQGDVEMKKDMQDNAHLSQPPQIITSKRMSYLDNLAASRSPTARH